MVISKYNSNDNNLTAINTLKLENDIFELNRSKVDDYLAIYNDVSDDDDKIECLTIYIDVSFLENKFREQDGEYEHKVAPSFSINPIYTKFNSVDELVGTSFTIESLDESDDREDTMYLYEHEPFMNYTLTIVELKDNMAHVVCTGLAITDGYTRPFITAEFNFNCWIPAKITL